MAIKKKKPRSLIQEKLARTVRKAFENYAVLDEEYLGEGLYLDLFIPEFMIGIELHGKQHYEFSPFFHVDAEGWSNQKRRDIAKEKLCITKDIKLVVFKYDEPIENESYILAKIHSAVASRKEKRFNES